MEKSILRVLVVDDYEPWRHFIFSSLQNWPELQIVGEASDGQEAVLKSRQLRPDLILIDIGLPSLNGIEAAKQIRRELPNARILFCSENRSLDVAEETLRVGAGGYLCKSDAGRDFLSAVISVIGGKRFVSRSLAGYPFAETSETSIRHQRHAVQFHADDAVLLDDLAALFRGSLGEGGSVVAIVTSSHRSSLEMRLLAQGVDVSEAARNGRLCIFDADQALSAFMQPAGPGRESFLLQFGNILRKLNGTSVAVSGGVVVFGEMVALLWEQKKYEAAIRLEELWNELGVTSSFYLCCAYPANIFRDGMTISHCADICAQHSHVVSAFGDLRSPA